MPIARRLDVLPFDAQTASEAPAWRLSVLCGLLASMAVILTLNGPGLTVDEPLDVRPGRNYLKILRQTGRHFLDRAVIDRVYRDNAEHPPLGRWWLGIASVLGEPFEVLFKGPDPTDSYVLAGRLAPALAFGVLVATIAGVGIRRFGRAAGLASAFALAAIPRVFAHAHLGALDTFLSLTWTAALLAGDRAVRSSQPPLAMIGAGAVWSLALLTKIHAWFLLPILGVWSTWRLGARRASVAMACWVATGIALFWLGWPWLWHDSWERITRYWGTGVARATIRVLYFGQIYADRDVPWHYPWFYFVVTVPLGLHALGLVGVVHGWRNRRTEPLPVLLAASILFFLVLFSTRVPVYDGERLFLLVFPAWALLAGLGFHRIDERLSNVTLRRGLIGLLALQGLGVVLIHPFGLSHYNLLVGGLAGAERLGLEVTYWSDAIDDVLLNRLARDAARDASAAMVPTLYPGQGVLTTGFNRALARRGIVLADQEAATTAEWVVVSRRSSYWPDAWRARMQAGQGRLVATRTRQGVTLAELWHFPAARQPRSPAPALTPGPTRQVR
ncbi:MAG: ArnT family glycosyltransferase [Isosphaeraceae bacterium]